MAVGGFQDKFIGTGRTKRRPFVVEDVKVDVKVDVQANYVGYIESVIDTPLISELGVSFGVTERYTFMSEIAPPAPLTNGWKVWYTP